MIAVLNDVLYSEQASSLPGRVGVRAPRGRPPRPSSSAPIDYNPLQALVGLLDLNGRSSALVLDLADLLVGALGGGELEEVDRVAGELAGGNLLLEEIINL